jgi:tetrahydromethanopterin S-methyltransferase subunit G
MMRTSKGSADMSGVGEFVTRDEFKQLATRVDVIEREVEGEKLVTRHILEQTRRNSDDLAAIKTRLDRVEEKVDSLDQKFDGLTRSLPTIVGDVMRGVLAEQTRKR